MENNLPDDQLEKYLRNSLSNYSESPSPDVWDKIDFTLDTQVEKRPPLKKKWLWMASAAAMFGIMIYLAATNIYLNNKLTQALENNNSITQKTNQKPIVDPSKTINDESINQTKVSNDVDSKNVTLELKDEKNNSVITAEEKSNKRDENSSSSEKESSSLTKLNSSHTSTSNNKEQNKSINKFSKESGSISSASATSSEKSKQEVKNRVRKSKQNEFIKNEIVNNIANDLNQAKSKLDKRNSADKVKDIPFIDAEFNFQRSVADAVKVNEVKSNRNLILIDKLKSIDNKLIVSVLPNKLLQVNTSTIEMPIQLPNNTNWEELSLFGGTINESGSLVEVRKFNNQVTPPSNNFATTHSWYSGIGYSKSINKNWYVNTGIGYKSYQLINNVNQSLTYRDRNNPMPGGPPSHHDWDFKLRCPGGSSNIVIQSEQLDTRAVISDNELIKIKITNKEELGYVAIPFVLNYRTASFGKFALTAGAGLHMNILTNSHFESPSVNIDHPQLIARQDQKRDFQFDRSNDIVLNGIVTGGISYAIAPKIKVQLSPSWIIPLTDRNSDRDVKVKSSSYGVQLGLNYSLASL